MVKQAILYARVSTDEQAEHGYSLQTQLESLREYAGRNGFGIVVELSEDCSGAKLSRPKLDTARGLLEQGQANVIVFYAPDRMSRSLAHSLILREEWNTLGVEVHFVSRGRLDTSAESDMTANIEAVFSEYWRAKIIEASKRGRIGKAQSGRHVAGSIPYGYKREGRAKTARVVLDEQETAIVRQIFAWYTGCDGERLSLLGIARRLDADSVRPALRGAKSSRGWYPGTVRAILQREAYIGTFYYRGIAIALPELAIIDRETWLLAQQQRAQNKENARRNRKRDYLFSGHLRCKCGAAMAGTSRKRSNGTLYQRYVCSSYGFRRHLEPCRGAVRVDRVDQLVWAWFFALINDEEQLATGVADWRRKSAATLETKKSRLALIDGLIERADRAAKRLAADYTKAIEDDDEKLAADYHEQHINASRRRDALEVERKILHDEVQAVGISEERERLIYKVVRAVRQRMNGAGITNMRELLELFDVQVKVRIDETGLRWLDCSCAVPDWHESIEYGRS